MPRSHHKTSTLKGQASIFSPQLTSTTKIFANENYLDEHQDTELKRTIINFIKELKDFKSHNQHTEVKEKEWKENKYLNDAQENTNIKLMEMMSTIQDLRTEFSKEIETLERAQA